MPTLTIGAKAQYTTLVSDADYLYVLQWKWTFKRSSKKYKYAIYARRCTWRGGRKVTILLSHVILERCGKRRPTADHTADHINNNTLDDTRENLRWATKRQQSRNQRRYKNAA